MIFFLIANSPIQCRLKGFNRAGLTTMDGRIEMCGLVTFLDQNNKF